MWLHDCTHSVGHYVTRCVPSYVASRPQYTCVGPSTLSSTLSSVASPFCPSPSPLLPVISHSPFCTLPSCHCLRSPMRANSCVDCGALLIMPCRMPVCAAVQRLCFVCVRPLSLPSARSPLLSFLSPLTLPCARCPPSIACALRCERVLCDICGALFSMPCRMPVFAAVQRLCFVCVLAAALVSLAMRVRCLTLRRLVGSPRCNYGS